MNISEVNQIYKCDSCKYEFYGNKVKTSPWASNIDIISFSSLVTVTDKNGNIYRKTRPDNADNVLECPKCSQVHLFGFDEVKQ